MALSIYSSSTVINYKAYAYCTAMRAEDYCMINQYSQNLSVVKTTSPMG